MKPPRQAPVRIVFYALAAGATGQAAAQQAAPPPPPPPEQQEIGKPRPLNYGDWITQSDYPTSALRDGAEGMVAFRLDIDAGGNVANCIITQRTGPLELAETTCRLIAERARFQSARDADGKAMAGSFSSRVRWKIPDGPYQIPKPGDSVVTMTIAPDGTVSDCSFSVAGAPETSVGDDCDVRYAARSEAGAVPIRVRITTRIKYLDAKPSHER